jgi:TetR/AcrR family transcriptional regulator, regulator of cefoperazone and chloramphenicol sensitivity
MDNGERPVRRRLKADDRRRQIVATAFETIAEKGFEGFRTREVAERVGINSATLHHYFPTKEALVEGVAEHLEQLYARNRAPTRATYEGEPAALGRLRQEFADVAFFRREHPRTWAVSREFMLRAPRDPTVATVIARLNERWCAGVEHVRAEGRDAGVFRAVHDPAAAAVAVVGALWGSVVLTEPDEARFTAICDEIEAWLTGKREQ